MEKQIEFVTKGRTLARYIGPGGDVAIPDGVAVIGGTAFSYSLNVTGVTIPDGVCRIGTSAFFGCANLGRINIPDSVTEIHTGAFEGCSALEDVSIPAGGRELFPPHESTARRNGTPEITCRRNPPGPPGSCRRP